MGIRAWLVDSQNYLLVVRRVSKVGELSPGTYNVFLPRAMLMSAVPTGRVEILIEHHDGASHQARPTVLQHRHRRRVQVVVDMQQSNGTGVLGKERQERLSNHPTTSSVPGTLGRVSRANLPAPNVVRQESGTITMGVSISKYPFMMGTCSFSAYLGSDRVQQIPEWGM